ncbi:phosphoglycolate phosphatase [Paenibacillus turicensis]|uniref:Phosphoglycolate phosphatase n=1 Tax=Paenibacillus turicensis TaxID=160487 RepID=A0ABS4FTK2_9BACL|nr:HAD family hydrolase [Paenibacillus turicensis]MBP1905774.1 phosphoglycolate phosphatase [Paenibacillus turicensis]
MDSIIFDLDGTLWDSRDVVVKAWNDVLKKYKEINKTLTKEDFKGVMGLQIKEIGMRFFPHLKEDMQQKILKECCEIESQYLTEQGGRLYEKLEETLEILSKKYKLLIVSNCQSAYMESFYNFHKLQRYFVDFENPGRTGLSKGENIKLVIARNNLTNPVYVGDTEGDQKAAKFAGVPFVFASYGFGEVSDFDYEINSFSGLLELF